MQKDVSYCYVFNFMSLIDLRLLAKATASDGQMTQNACALSSIRVCCNNA